MTLPAMNADPLSPRQRELITAWFPGHEVVADHSWGLVATTVLEIRWRDERFIVKAGGADDRHIGREVTAHESWTGPLVQAGRAARLVKADREAKLLATTYLPGRLVQGDPAVDRTDVYAQAGAALRHLHTAEAPRDDGDFARRERDDTLRWLDRPHRIEAAAVRRLRALVQDWPTPMLPVVPTHGDYTPRNWLVDRGTAGGDGDIRVIDFGRADRRPAYTDFARLSEGDFQRDVRLEAAFVEGYGADPRPSDPAAWQRHRIREAVGTAAWAHAVGDDDFERHGLEMTQRVLADLG